MTRLSATAVDVCAISQPPELRGLAVRGALLHRLFGIAVWSPRRQNSLAPRLDLSPKSNLPVADPAARQMLIRVRVDGSQFNEVWFLVWAIPRNHTTCISLLPQVVDSFLAVFFYGATLVCFNSTSDQIQLITNTLPPTAEVS